MKLDLGVTVTHAFEDAQNSPFGKTVNSIALTLSTGAVVTIDKPNNSSGGGKAYSFQIGDGEVIDYTSFYTQLTGNNGANIENTTTGELKKALVIPLSGKPIFSSDQNDNEIPPANETNVGEAPTGADGTVKASRGSDYDFTATDFMKDFSDPDGDSFKGVKIITLPIKAQGVLKVGAADVTAGQKLDRTDIDDLVFEVPASGAPSAAYTASFRFRVVDEGGDESIESCMMSIAVPAVTDMSLTVPTTKINGSAIEMDDLKGTASDELIQGGGQDDRISSGGGADILIGSFGDDHITLGQGAQTVIYRFDSTKTSISEAEGEWVAIDGGDTIVKFELGVDKLLFVDTNPNGINMTADFFEKMSLAVADENNDADIPTNIDGVMMLIDETNNYMGIEIKFEETAGKRDLTDMNKASDSLKIHFSDPIFFDTSLSNQIDILVTQSLIAPVNPSRYRALFDVLFTNDTINVTSDTTPSGIGLI